MSFDGVMAAVVGVMLVLSCDARAVTRAGRAEPGLARHDTVKREHPPARRPPMAAITRDGITLVYEERGAGVPAMVFVHGWTM